jgi:hypothetical protein
MVRTAHSPIVAQLTSDHLPSTSQQGMQLMPNPGGIRVLKATFEHDGDLVPVVDIIRPLMQRHIIGNAPVLRPGLTDAITHRTKADFENDDRGVVKREEETKFYKEFTSGTFSCHLFVLKGGGSLLHCRGMESLHGLLWTGPDDVGHDGIRQV